jgi:hypothetical protein
MKDWLKRQGTNRDNVVIGLGLGIGLPLIMSGLTFADIVEALPALVWLTIAGVAAIFLLGVLVGRRRGHHKATEEANRKIERVNAQAQENLEREVEVVRREERQLREDREQTAERYAEHVSDALDTLEKILTGRLSAVALGDFVNEGLLEPAHALLMQTGDRGDVRFSILKPDEDEKEFKMPVAHGHDMDSRRRFGLKIPGSFAGLAYSSGEVKWSNNLEDDNRFEPHPHARPGRAYNSIVSVPLRHAGEVVGVLVAIAVEKEAFSPVDRIYIRTLGSVHDVAWSVVQEAKKQKDEEGREAS